MKVTWEPADVMAGRLVRSKTSATNNKAILGYSPGGGIHVISLSDGLLVLQGKTAGEVADWLNQTGHLPTDDDREATAAIDWLRGRR